MEFDFLTKRINVTERHFLKYPDGIVELQPPWDLLVAQCIVIRGKVFRVASAIRICTNDPNDHSEYGGIIRFRCATAVTAEEFAPYLQDLLRRKKIDGKKLKRLIVVDLDDKILGEPPEDLAQDLFPS